MSANYMTVSGLIEKLKGFPADMQVVSLRHPEWRLAGPVEFDGIKHITTIDVMESWDVYVPDKSRHPQQTVLVLSPLNVHGRGGILAIGE